MHKRGTFRCYFGFQAIFTKLDKNIKIKAHINIDFLEL